MHASHASHVASPLLAPGSSYSLPTPCGAPAPTWPCQGFAAPPRPPDLASLPDLQDISLQKEEHKRRLEEQLRQGEDILGQQANRQRDYVRMQAEQQKALATGQCDQQLRVEEISLEQQYQRQLEELHENARRQKLQLHKQASELVLEYNARKAQEEINHRQYEIQLQHWEADNRTGAEMARVAEEQRRAQLELGGGLGLSHLSRQRQEQAAYRAMDGLPEFTVDRWMQQQLAHPQAAPGWH